MNDDSLGVRLELDAFEGFDAVLVESLRWSRGDGHRVVDLPYEAWQRSRRQKRPGPHE